MLAPPIQAAFANHLGDVHTGISLIALAAGTVALVRDWQISPKSKIGRLYIAITVLTCLTAFPMMQHGGSGPAGVLVVVTLLVLALARSSAQSRSRGAWRDADVVCYTATYFIQLISATAEIVTRLPAGVPFVADRNGPVLQAVDAVLLGLLMMIATLQVRRRRAVRVARRRIFIRGARECTAPYPSL